MSTLAFSNLEKPGGPSQPTLDGSAKTWARTGTGTVAGDTLLDTLNISSLIQLSGGQYQMNLITNFTNSDYCVSGSSVNNNTTEVWGQNLATGSYSLYSFHSGSYANRELSSMVFGDLA